MIVTDRKSIIMDRNNKEPYLVRYYILFKDRNPNIPFNIFIHKFMKGDDDELHNHPWGWGAFIIKGGYWEHTPEGKFWRGPGHLRFRSAQDLHWLELAKDENGNLIPCWSLFFMGKKAQSWGFVKNGKWIDNKDYLKNV